MADEAADGRPPAHDGQRRKKRSSKSHDKRHHRPPAGEIPPAESKNSDHDRVLRGTESSAQFSQWTDAMQRQQTMDRAAKALTQEEVELQKGLTSAPSMAQFSQWTESQKRKERMDAAEAGAQELNEAKGLTSAPSMAQFSQWTESQKRKERMDAAEAGAQELNEAKGLTSAASMAQFSQWTESQKRKERMDAAEAGAQELNEAKGLTSAASMAQFSQWTDSMKRKERMDAVQDVAMNDKELNEARGLSSAASMAQFSQWTESMKKKKDNTSGAKSSGGGGEEDYEEEFEDYDDEDFEDDDEGGQPPNKQQSAATVPSAQPKPTDNGNHSNGSKLSAKKARNILESPQLRVTDNKKITNGLPKRKSEEDFQADSKSSTNKPNVRKERPMSGRAKKFENMQISFTSSALGDPRGIRIKRIIDSGVMELQLESRTVINVPKSTQYDFYNTVLLRRNPAEVRQIGVPLDLEQREMECNTDPIEVDDKMVQFTYGDDTDFYDILADVKKRKHQRDQDLNGENSKRDDLLHASNVYHQQNVKKTQHDAYDGEGDAIDSMNEGNSASRLTNFLQRASFLCESILQEQSEKINNSGEGKDGEFSGGRLGHAQLFESGSEWITFGKDPRKGANELLRTRSVTSLHFSPLQPHLIVSVHPFPTDGNAAEDDLRPYKGLHCVWDVANPGGPLFVLEGTGQPTCATFSSSQTYLLIGGTYEGSLHLWDLREQSSIHKDRDSMDLRIDKGIRKPCYSTNLSFLLSAHDVPETDDWQHSSPVVQIEALTSFEGNKFSTSMNVVSQFVSIDESGLVIFWITTQQATSSTNVGDVAEDLQRSPWGNVALVQTRQLHAHQHFPMKGLSGSNTSSPVKKDRDSEKVISANRKTNSTIAKTGNKRGGVVPPGELALASIPDNLSTVIVTQSEGTIGKLARYGEPPHPHTLYRAHHGLAEFTIDDGRQSHQQVQEVHFFAAVTCMVVRSSIDTSTASLSTIHDKADELLHSTIVSSAPLLLVGRKDGTIDLFQLDSEIPLQSWSLSAFTENDTKGGRDNGKSKLKPAAVVMLKWCSSRAAVFYAADSRGNLFLFDLHRSPYKPLQVETVSKQKILSNLIDVSNVTPGSGFFYTAVADITKSTENDSCSIRARRMSAAVAKCTNDQLIEEEIQFRSELHALSSTRCDVTLATFRSVHDDREEHHHRK